MPSRNTKTPPLHRPWTPLWFVPPLLLFVGLRNVVYFRNLGRITITSQANSNMSGYDEPAWLSQQTDDKKEVTQDANTGGNLSAPEPETQPRRSGGLALSGLSFLGMGLAGMMTALGVLTLIEVHNRGLGDDFSEPFLASYMILFAILLFTYELMWWSPVPSVNKAMRKNFGFMYGLRGKGLYLIFAGCLCLGLGNDASVKALNWATGITFLAVGCLHWFVVCFHPDLAMTYVAPTAGLTAEGEVPASDNVV